MHVIKDAWSRTLIYMRYCLTSTNRAWDLKMRREVWRKFRSPTLQGLLRQGFESWTDQYLLPFRNSNKFIGIWEILNKTQPEKTADIWRRYHCFPRQMTSEKRVQKFHIPISCWCFWLVEWNFPRGTLTRSTTQIWVVTLHQYGISALDSQTSFGGETSGSVAKCQLFSQPKQNRVAKTLGLNVFWLHYTTEHTKQHLEVWARRSARPMKHLMNWREKLH